MVPESKTFQSALRLAVTSKTSLFIHPARYIVSSACLREVEGIRRGNVALKRPSWQSSTHCDRYDCYVADKGNDLRKNPKRKWGECSHTGNDVHPWWAVDLGSQQYVDGIVLFRSNDCCGA